MSKARNIYKDNKNIRRGINVDAGSAQTSAESLLRQPQLSCNWLFNAVWHDRLDIGNSFEQIVNDLLAFAAANILDFLELDLDVLLSILLGLLIATGMLDRWSVCVVTGLKWVWAQAIVGGYALPSRTS